MRNSSPPICPSRLDGGVPRHRAQDRGAQIRRDGPVVVSRGVARGDMPDLVRQDAGELGLGIGERQQPAGDVDIPSGQCEGIDLGRVQNREGEPEVGHARSSDQTAADLRHVGADLDVVVHAAEPREHLGMLACADTPLLRGRHERSQFPFPGSGIGRHATGESREREQQGAQNGRSGGDATAFPVALHGDKSSICSGCVTSIMGPFRR